MGVRTACRIGGRPPGRKRPGRCVDPPVPSFRHFFEHPVGACRSSTEPVLFLPGRVVGTCPPPSGGTVRVCSTNDLMRPPGACYRLPKITVQFFVLSIAELSSSGLIPTTEDRYAPDGSVQEGRIVARRASRLVLPECFVATCTANFSTWYYAKRARPSGSDDLGSPLRTLVEDELPAQKRSRIWESGIPGNLGFPCAG